MYRRCQIGRRNYPHLPDKKERWTNKTSKQEQSVFSAKGNFCTKVSLEYLYLGLLVWGPSMFHLFLLWHTTRLSNAQVRQDGGKLVQSTTHGLQGAQAGAAEQSRPSYWGHPLQERAAWSNVLPGECRVAPSLASCPSRLNSWAEQCQLLVYSLGASPSPEGKERRGRSWRPGLPFWPLTSPQLVPVWVERGTVEWQGGQEKKKIFPGPALRLGALIMPSTAALYVKEKGGLHGVCVSLLYPTCQNPAHKWHVILHGEVAAQTPGNCSPFSASQGVAVSPASSDRWNPIATSGAKALSKLRLHATAPPPPPAICSTPLKPDNSTQDMVPF